MTLREKLAKINAPDQLADLTEIIDEVDKLQGDLDNANSIIGEKDKKISELQDQSNRLYARLLLSDVGTVEEKEDTWEDMEGEDALEAFLKNKEDK